MFKLGFHWTILRFHLMILLTIGVVLSGNYWLTAIPMAVAVSAILGFRPERPDRREGRIVSLEETPILRQRRAG